ncbi:MAG: hypothetical protein GY822_26785 [Deltaproteobacteria bacterium]|nr:hypothetical protein [Deltaproteobacteria bacterium]
MSLRNGTTVDDQEYIPCSTNSYNTESNLSYCNTKQTCVPGEEVSEDGGGTGDRSCSLCAEQTYTSTTNTPMCLPFASCAPGTFETFSATSITAPECYGLQCRSILCGAWP